MGCSFTRKCLIVPFVLAVPVVIFKLKVLLESQYDPFIHVQATYRKQNLSEFDIYLNGVRELNGTAELLKNAKEIQAKHGLVMIAIINDAFLPFTLSWMCNTKDMNIHDHIIYITTDEYSKGKLSKTWRSKSVYIPSLHLSGNQSFSKVGYVKLMNLRTQMILLMLVEHINVFLFETDCVWLSNPLPEIKLKMKSHDMLLVWQSRGTSILGGFMVLRNTTATISLWKALSTKMWKLYKKIKNSKENAKVSKLENDQVYFTKLVTAKYAKVKAGYLSNKKYADGKWYGFSKKEQKQVKPVVINNNWISGNDKKIQRAQSWGHWFLRKDGKCDAEKVSKVVTLKK